jgi:hypothetical protein
VHITRFACAVVASPTRIATTANQVRIQSV